MKKIFCLILSAAILAAAVGTIWHFRATLPARTFIKDFQETETLEFNGNFIVSNDEIPGFSTRIQGRISENNLYLKIMDLQGNVLVTYYDAENNIRWDLKPMLSYLLAEYEIPEKISSPILNVSGFDAIIVSQEQLDFLIAQLERIDSVPDVMYIAPAEVRMQMSSMLQGKLSPARKPQKVLGKEALEGYRFCSSKQDPERLLGVRKLDETHTDLLYLAETAAGRLELQLDCTFSETVQPVVYPDTLLSPKGFEILRSGVEWMDDTFHLASEFYEYLKQSQP